MYDYEYTEFDNMKYYYNKIIVRNRETFSKVMNLTEMIIDKGSYALGSAFFSSNDGVVSGRCMVLRDIFILEFRSNNREKLESIGRKIKDF